VLNNRVEDANKALVYQATISVANSSDPEAFKLLLSNSQGNKKKQTKIVKYETNINK
jgi:hypothetical protein